ncbi:NADH-quinone oxidoreductase subunit N [Rhodoligotrophos appendicifer]|uniref:NADH-quinone oxidoreductase subunit NuoN n=1 Tax=Rhodoligotrophos appendicifer TaxID=987056 RepID=UPI001186D47F|nr:NADH-quinone oxidoreductase subunit NuoN [Rhodoligotrophos appendicifer]
MVHAIATADILAILPEIVLAVGAMALLMIGVFRKGDPVELISSLAIVLLAIVALLILLDHDGGRHVAFGGSLMIDSFGRFMKILAVFASAAVILLSVQFLKSEHMMRFEFPVLICLATLGMLVLISANDLIAVYLGLEMMSLSLYVVAAINRDSARSSEAGLKYFVLGALSSGMLLYGSSLIYGFTGTVSFDGIRLALGSGEAGIGLLIGLSFLITGFAFKTSLVPFHMWTPDVYEGAPTPVTAFFASAPKVAAAAVFVRAMIVPFPTIAADWQQIVVFLSIASMALGSFAAIGQTNIKRLMAYSSIANMGYAMIGLAAGSPEGVRGLIIYMTIYMFMTLGSFAVIMAMRRGEGAVETIADLAGLSRNNKPLAFVMAVMMFSMAGIPPLAGFFAKFFVFSAAIKAGLVTLAIIGVVTSVVGAYYYLRIVKIMYFDEPADRFVPAPTEIRVVLGVSAFVILAFVVFARPVLTAAQAAAASLF